MVKLNTEELHIAIATPTTKGLVTVEYSDAMWSTQVHLSENGIKASLLRIDGAAVDKSRNILLSMFLSHTRFSHILFIDDDEGWKPEVIVRLLAMDKEFIGVAIRKKSNDVIYNVNFSSGIETDTFSWRVKDIGTGFILLKRSVIEKMISNYPNLKAKPDKNVPYSDNLYRFFGSELDEENNYIGEDVAFCRKWTAIGGKIWIDPESEVAHVGKKLFEGCIADNFAAEQQILEV